MTRTQNDRAMFDRLQADIRATHAEHTRVRLELVAKYGALHYAPAGKRAQLDRLQARESRLGDRLFTLLDRVSPRSWRSGAPWHWIVTELTYSDAIAAGALSVVPPPAYGYTDRDARQFAAAIDRAIAS